MDTYRDIRDPHYAGGIWFTRNQEAGNLSSSSDIVFGAMQNWDSGLPTERLRVYATNYTQATGSLRAPIFYDSDDTAYYVNPNSTSVLSKISTGTGDAIYIGGQNVTSSAALRIQWNGDSDLSYQIGKRAGAWVQPMDIAFYTGIRYHAAAGYGGHKFYTNGYDSVLSFSVGDGDNHTRVYNNLYAPIMYDQDNTGTYINPNGSSIINSGGGYPMEFRSTQRYISRFWNQNVSGYGFWLANDANTLVFHADSVGDKASLDSSGNFIAYGSSRAPIFYDYDDTTYYLNPNGYSQINGNGSVNGSSGVGMSIYSTGGNGTIMAFHRGGYYAVNMGLDSDNVIRIGGWSAASNRLQMDMSGNLTMAGNITAYSDIRIKKDITVIENALEKVSKIRGVTYTRIDEGSSNARQSGVIAQEVELVLPEVVSEDASGIKNVAYGNMVGLLIEAIKEQQIEIQQMKSLINTLIAEKK
jgi:hypothetical protein